MDGDGIRNLRGAVLALGAGLRCPECGEVIKSDGLYLVAIDIEKNGNNYVYLLLKCTQCNYDGLPIVNDIERVEERVLIKGSALRCSECGEIAKSRDLRIIAVEENGEKYAYLLLRCTQCDLYEGPPIVLFTG